MPAEIASISDHYPCLRSDLQTSRLQTAEGCVIQIHDPRGGGFFRLPETEYQIAAQFDGSRSPADVAASVAEQHQIEISVEAIEEFLAQLDELGLLQSEDGQSVQPANVRVKGSVLHLRIRVIDPDRILQWLTRPLWFLFTPAFLALSVAVLLAAVAVALTNHEHLTMALLDLVTLRYIVAGLVVVAFVALLHESAHGLTCRHFGGPVRDMGFLLIYFMPAFYCDVTSAWGFQRKSDRLWVTFAGIWCNLLLWACAVFLWRGTQSDTWVHTAALLLMGMTGVDTFFNLLPLIKLDGYYLLSDALDAPNLRQNSFAFLGQHIKRFFGAPDATVSTVSVRLKSIYFVYGTAAAVFSAVLLTLVSINLGEFLMSRYQVFGFFIYLAALGLIFLRPLSALAARMLSVVASPLAVFGRNAWVVRLLLLVVTPVTCVLLCPWELSVIGDAAVHSDGRAEIRAQADGLIESVLVSEGDHVDGRQVVVRLSNPQRDTEGRQAEFEIEQQQAQLDLLRAGARPEQIALAEAAVVSAQTQVEHAQLRLDEAMQMRTERLQAARAVSRAAETILTSATAEFDRHRLLRERQAVSTVEFERRQSAVESAQAGLDAASARERLQSVERLTEFSGEVAIAEAALREAKLKVKALKAGPRKEELCEIEAEIKRLTAKKEHLDDLCQCETIQSPIEGIVTTRNLSELRHRRIERGELIAVVQRFETVRVEMLISEREQADVSLGKKIDIKVLAYPDRVFSGEVTAISPEVISAEVGSPGSGRLVVTTQVDNQSLLLKPGMSGKARIHCGQSRVVSIIARKLSQYVSVEFWSWW